MFSRSGLTGSMVNCFCINILGLQAGMSLASVRKKHHVDVIKLTIW